jgi:hypothetical protein
MLLALLAALQLAPDPSGAVYHARRGETEVRAPALADLERQVTIDGVLDEAAWARAAVLTGFSVYQPVDRRPSPDSTEVLVWYAPEAIYFGVRAFEPHGTVRATLADRDKVDADDNVEIHLDTYDERNRAIVFIVNALGVQADGTKSEGGGFIPGSNVFPGENDLSADYTWTSRGRLTEEGYEVEIRIPFSSLRYPTADVQRWGIQVQRNIQHSGYRVTWTEARRAAASFIDQEGALVGLTGMHHGQVVQLNPELTNTATGGRAAGADPGFPGQASDWSYDNEPRLGGNVRWAMGSNVVLNGTVNPDFSQVEADATQIAEDERFALFYAERRPFFVEGADQFNVPNTLVYTRRVVRPEAAVKLTGKVGRTDVAVMSAVDDPATTADGSRPFVGILRVRRGIGTQSTAGVLFSERSGGGRGNHLGGADVRWVFGGLYYAQLQGALAVTTEDGSTTTAPMWEAAVDRTGRSYGFHYSVKGLADGFAADNGFVQRTDVVDVGVANRFTLYGGPGALAEQLNTFVRAGALWRYDDFFDGRSLLEDGVSMNNELTLRGGWSLGVSPTIGSYAFDLEEYAHLFTGLVAAPAPFVPSDRITTFTTRWSVSTPQFTRFAASVGLTSGRDVDFLETSRIHRTDWDASLDVRPTQQLRIGATWRSSRFTRISGDERTQSTRIPRLKFEYQVTRAIFLRLVAQYTATERAALRDPRTGRVLLTRTAPGVYAPTAPTASNELRADWLFSYRPTPGTVFFFGYGNTMTEPDALGFSRLRRTDDAFFVKLSYLFHALGPS